MRLATNMIYCGDCLSLLRAMPKKCVDLILGSPPYVDCRTYGIGFKLKGQAWVDWMVERMVEMVRVSRGLVAMVVEGKTKNFQWDATPALLMADLHRAGIVLRKPPVFYRVGIPGSGGPDWLRGDTEWIVCATGGGKLPWSDNTACGHRPKWAPGGAMSNRTTDGQRKNARDKPETKAARRNKLATPSQTQRENGANGSESYVPPANANPGNVIQERYTVEEVAAMLAESGDVTKHIVGGGVMGSKLAHENEAPFPETLADFFIRSFCKPGGVVLDPFCGSGTALKVAKNLGRQYIGMDVRQSQVELSQRRVMEVS